MKIFIQFLWPRASVFLNSFFPYLWPWINRITKSFFYLLRFKCIWFALLFFCSAISNLFGAASGEIWIEIWYQLVFYIIPFHWTSSMTVAIKFVTFKTMTLKMTPCLPLFGKRTQPFCLWTPMGEAWEKINYWKDIYWKDL